MDWRECKVFWNPHTGFIRVADQHDPHPSKSIYPMWLAGREAETAGLAWDDHRVVAKVFVEFSSIVVRDEIPARKAHKAFPRNVRWKVIGVGWIESLSCSQ